MSEDERQLAIGLLRRGIPRESVALLIVDRRGALEPTVAAYLVAYDEVYSELCSLVWWE